MPEAEVANSRAPMPQQAKNGERRLVDLSSIAELRIYPPLGIARVGNAEDKNAEFSDDYVIGPEVLGGVPTLPNGATARYSSDFRTDDGSIERQAARFRIYAHFRDGSIREITATQGYRIEWSVTVANLKAGWYEFNQAMDLPHGLSKDARRRNESVPIIPGGRSTLDIVPTPRSIEGCGKFGPQYQFNDGTFWNKQVYLGELRNEVTSSHRRTPWSILTHITTSLLRKQDRELAKQEGFMAKIRVIAHAMNQEEINDAYRILENPQKTDAFVLGDIDETRLGDLRAAGLIVEPFVPVDSLRRSTAFSTRRVQVPDEIDLKRPNV
jgi:hypothetical protein